MKFISRVAWITTIVTFMLIVLGGTALATAPGLSCPAWLLCANSASSLGIFEQFQRLTVLAVGMLVLLLVVGLVAWVRRDQALCTMAIGAPALLVAQIILGGLTVFGKLSLQLLAVQALFAIILASLLLNRRPAVSRENPLHTRRFALLAIVNVLFVYLLLLLGSYVTGSGTGIAMLHDVFAGFVGLVLLWTVIAALLRWRVAPGQAAVALVVGLLFVCQALVGALIVFLNNPAWLVETHLSLAVGVWCSLVLLAALASRQLRAVPATAEIAVHQSLQDVVAVVRQTCSSYMNLIKPHVTVLLLGVTLAAMAMATRGLPPLALIIPTLLGGAMAAGSANCINCYIDRDIDEIMGRTQRRALPSGHVEPRQALIFGIVLGICSFILLSAFVNLLSALLACSAILFYVFVYTLGLKRTTTQNIVIGGAAGAVPVLVGWAAITNNLSLTAIWLFAIIFFWTPPHFWALSLLIQKDYAKANIPMLPVVKGEAETHRQILLYSLLLLVITVLLFVTGTMGYIFLVGGVALGAWLVYLAIRLWLHHSKSWARQLFWYSNMYLAAIFALMVVDRVIH